MKNDFLKNVVTKTMKKPSGRIKGWKKIGAGFPITYRNNNNREIYISRSGKSYFVRLYDGNTKFFFSKVRALKYASNYMRANPNG